MLQLLGGGEHFLGMTRDLHFGPDPGYATVAPDQEGSASYPNELLAKHGFLAPHPIGVEHLVRLVGGERYAETMLRLERVLCLHGIGGDTQNRGAVLLEGGGEHREG